MAERMSPEEWGRLVAERFNMGAREAARKREAELRPELIEAVRKRIESALGFPPGAPGIPEIAATAAVEAVEDFHKEAGTRG